MRPSRQTALRLHKALMQPQVGAYGNETYKTGNSSRIRFSNIQILSIINLLFFLYFVALVVLNDGTGNELKMHFSQRS